MKGLLDGDILLYAAAFSIEHTVYEVVRGGSTYSTESAKDYKEYIKRNELEEGDYELIRHRRTEPVELAYKNLTRSIEDINDRLALDSYICCLSGDHNFRQQIEPNYKANREDADKPIFLDDVRKYLIHNFPTITTPYIEADDCMGIVQYDNYMNNGRDLARSDTCIVTIDKDLDQIPGHHYNPNTTEAYWLEDSQADYCFWYQMLVGDTADNIKGCPGIGPKKATRYLDEYEGRFCEDVESYVLAKYRETYPDALSAEQAFDLNKVLLGIARRISTLPIGDKEQKELERIIDGI